MLGLALAVLVIGYILVYAGFTGQKPWTYIRYKTGG